MAAAVFSCCAIERAATSEREEEEEEREEEKREREDGASETVVDDDDFADDDVDEERVALREARRADETARAHAGPRDGGTSERDDAVIGAAAIVNTKGDTERGEKEDEKERKKKNW